MTALQSHTTHNAATVSQHATLAALTRREESDEAVAAMVAAFRERRDAALEVLRGVPGLQIVRPGGAFYLFLNVVPFAADAVDAGSEITRRLLDEQGVAVVPGVAFGTPGWIRMSYAAPLSQVVEGARRIAAVLGTHRA
jgi:aspartate aminotransferase